LPAPVEATIVRLKRESLGWGAPKIREKLRQQCPQLAHRPPISTVPFSNHHGLRTPRWRRLRTCHLLSRRISVFLALRNGGLLRLGLASGTTRVYGEAG
jgi:hypothetical protein